MKTNEDEAFHCAKAGDADLPHMATVTAVAVGAGVILGAAGIWRRRQRARRTAHQDAGRDALRTYLLEHLGGSDMATQMVERLRRSLAGTAEGRLSGSLFEQFQVEREILRGILHELGSSSVTVKRAASLVGGRLLAQAGGGVKGDLALFRTLEGLAVGIQGKRCLWRALQGLPNELRTASPARLRELELMAVRQWEAVEEQRRALVSFTFTTTVEARDVADHRASH